MAYRSNSIPNIRTIKALRGEALKIDLGKELQGTIEAWMKRDPNSDSYRSFEVQDGRYLYLTSEKASDYVVDDIVTEAIEGKWYFDVEQDLNDGSDKKTIYRGTILFQNDITGSNGSEGTPPPAGSIPTSEIRLVDAVLESVSGVAATQQDSNTEFATEIKLLKQAAGTSKPYNFDATEDGVPVVGDFTFDSDEFVSTTLIRINEIDSEGLDNSYLFEGLKVGSSLVFRGIASGAGAVFTISNAITEISGVYNIPVAHDNSSGTILSDNEPVELEGFSSAGSSVLERDITVAGIQDDTIGVNNGEKLTAGSSITDNIERIVRKRIPPTYSAPSAGLSVSPSSTQEIGDTVSYTLTPTFTQRDAGAVNNVVFKRGGLTIHTQATLTPYVDATRIVSAGSTQYSVEISYDQGAIKDDNLGDPDPTGRIEAGTVSQNRSVSGAYSNWYGPNGSSEPADGNEIRTLSSSFSNTFTLNTGDSALVHVISIPATDNLVSVIDVDALNADLTSSYILSSTLTSVPDAGGNPVAYKTYILTVAQAYSSNHRHNVTTS